MQPLLYISLDMKLTLWGLRRFLKGSINSNPPETWNQSFLSSKVEIGFDFHRELSADQQLERITFLEGNPKGKGKADCKSLSNNSKTFQGSDKIQDLGQYIV